MSWRSRKWQLTMFFSVVSTSALFFDKINGAEFIQIAIVLVSAYTMGNVGSKYVGGKHNEPRDEELYK